MTLLPPCLEYVIFAHGDWTATRLDARLRSAFSDRLVVSSTIIETRDIKSHQKLCSPIRKSSYTQGARMSPRVSLAGAGGTYSFSSFLNLLGVIILLAIASTLLETPSTIPILKRISESDIPLTCVRSRLSKAALI